MKRLDSGFRRNDEKWQFPTFYEFITFKRTIIHAIHIPTLDSSWKYVVRAKIISLKPTLACIKITSFEGGFTRPSPHIAQGGIILVLKFELANDDKSSLGGRNAPYYIDGRPDEHRCRIPFNDAGGYMCW
jgi:hypothetical protein